MKSIAVIALFGAIASAQNFEGADSCGKTCGTAMVNQYSTLSCPSNSDYSCLCSKNNFLYGLRDCNSEACGGSSANTNSYKTLCPNGAAILDSGEKTNSATVSSSSLSSSSGSGSGAGGSSSSSVIVVSMASTSGVFTTTVSATGGVATVVVSTGTDSGKFGLVFLK